MKITRKDMLLLVAIWLVASVMSYFSEKDTSADFQGKIENSYKTTALVTKGEHAHSRRSDSYSIEYSYTGFDGFNRTGKSFIHEGTWESLNNQPSEKRVIDIYQSRLNPSESYWSGDWEMRANKSYIEQTATAGMLGLLLTVPIFLILKGVGFVLRKLKTISQSRSELPRTPASTPSLNASSDKLDAKLRQLKNLYDDGLITTEEFQKKKAEILHHL